MSMNTVPERLAALRAAMAANGVAVYLIPVRVTTRLEFSPWNPENQVRLV